MKIDRCRLNIAMKTNMFTLPHSQEMKLTACLIRGSFYRHTTTTKSSEDILIGTKIKRKNKKDTNLENTKKNVRVIMNTKTYLQNCQNGHY